MVPGPVPTGRLWCLHVRRRDDAFAGLRPAELIEVVKLVTERGVSVAQACRDLELAESVLRRWMPEAASALPVSSQQRADMSEIAAPQKEAAKLEAERDIPQKGRGLLCAESDMTFALVAKHRHVRPVSWMCEVLSVSRPASMPGSSDRSATARPTTRSSSWRSTGASRPVIALILSDPINIHYATGARNMQVFCQRNAPSRYLLLTAAKSILFEFTGCLHLGQGFETIDEVRSSKTASFVAAGPDIQAREKAWAAEMADLVIELVGKGATLGLERLNAGTAIALRDCGLRIVDAQQPVEMARSVKSDEEIKCINASLWATETGVAKLRAAIRPGITEIDKTRRRFRKGVWRQSFLSSCPKWPWPEMPSLPRLSTR